MTDSDDLFEVTYSPRKIRFFLAHAEEVEVMALYPRQSRDTAARQIWEWQQLQDRRGLDCMCSENAGPDYGEAPTGGGPLGSGSHRASLVQGDLETAALALPLNWEITRRICAVLGTLTLKTWEKRYVQRHGFPARLDLAPSISGASVLMAKSLGWVSPIRGGALRRAG